MTLADFKDWLKTQVSAENWYVGKRDEAKEESITLYPTQPTAPIIAIGQSSSYTTKAVSILVHWGKYFTAAEQKANEVYDAIFGQHPEIGGHRVVHFDTRTAEPVGVGTDSAGIYEFVINLVIYYTR